MTIIAIDMGHSRCRPTVGVSLLREGNARPISDNVQFYQAVNLVRNVLSYEPNARQNLVHLRGTPPSIIRINPERQITLIIEAPLTYLYRRGNPAVRQFIRNRQLDGEGGNGWYYGAGAQTAHASLMFLNIALQGVTANFGQIQLFEGFVPRTRARDLDHAGVALALLNALRRQDGRYIFDVDLPNMNIEGNRLFSIRESLQQGDLLGPDFPRVVIPFPPRRG